MVQVAGVETMARTGRAFSKITLAGGVAFLSITLEDGTAHAQSVFCPTSLAGTNQAGIALQGGTCTNGNTGGIFECRAGK